MIFIKVHINLLKDKITNIFLIVFCFLMLFGFNSDRISESLVYNSIVIPYFNVNITLFLAVLSIITMSLLLLFKPKIDTNFIILIIRIILYAIPLIYITGEFKIGVFYSIVQCALSYFIGLNSEKKLKSFVTILTIYTIMICLEVFYVLIANKLSIFSESLKWFMILPMGRYNYITCILLPTYAFIINYNKEKKALNIIYSIIIFCAIVSTGSRLAMLIYILYIAYNFLKKYKSKLNKSKFLFDSLLILFLCIICIYVFRNNHDNITSLLSKFNFESLTTSRFLVYKDIFKLVHENPILGRSAFAYKAFDAIKAHNFLLESLVQTGIIGTMIFIYLLISSIKKINLINNQKVKSAFMNFITIYLIQGSMEPNMFGSTSDAYFWFILGIGICQYNYYNNKIEKK